VCLWLWGGGWSGPQLTRLKPHHLRRGLIKQTPSHTGPSGRNGKGCWKKNVEKKQKFYITEGCNRQESRRGCPICKNGENSTRYWPSGQRPRRWREKKLKGGIGGRLWQKVGGGPARTKSCAQFTINTAPVTPTNQSGEKWTERPRTRKVERESWGRTWKKQK